MIVALDDPRAADVQALLARLDAYLHGLYPAESNHIIGVEALCAPSVRFFTARRDGALLGTGAVVISGEQGEIKRMMVSEAARGLGLGRALLAALEQAAREAGASVMRLETGIHQPEAIGLYRASGYSACGPYPPYGEDPLSLFMEKRLSA